MVMDQTAFEQRENILQGFQEFRLKNGSSRSHDLAVTVL